MVLVDTEKNFDAMSLGVSHLLALITDRFHHDLRKGQPSIAHFGLVFLSYILQNQLVAAYELAYHLSHSLLLALPRTNQGWNCAMGHVTKTMMDQIVGVLSQVIQLQFIVAVLDAIGREHSKQDMFQHLHTTNDAFSINHNLLDTLISNGRQFILSFRSLIPTISYAIRAVLLHLSVFVRYVTYGHISCLQSLVSFPFSERIYRPDLAYILLQNGYKVDWAAYLTAVQDLENSWNALIYARRHSKVDLWKSIDPDWRDEGYQFVYLISREESYAVRPTPTTITTAVW